MPIYGDLGTMPLPDLLQWIGGAKKTGILELEPHSVLDRPRTNLDRHDEGELPQAAGKLGRLIPTYAATHDR